MAVHATFIITDDLKCNLLALEAEKASACLRKQQQWEQHLKAQRAAALKMNNDAYILDHMYKENGEYKFDANCITGVSKRFTKRAKKTTMDYEIPLTVVDTITVVPDPEIVLEKPAETKIQHRCKVQKIVRQPKLVAGGHVVDNMLRFVVNQAKRTNLQIRVISGKSNNQLHFKNTRFGRQPFALVKHCLRKVYRRDCTTDRFTNKIIALMLKKQNIEEPIELANITYGDSGMILKKNRIYGRFIQDIDDEKSFLIVRGRHSEGIIDACMTVALSEVSKIKHYSIQQLYFNAFSNKYVQFRKNVDEHECAPTIDVRRCGEVAALLYQFLFPSNKITCMKCIKDIENLGVEGFIKLVLTGNDEIEMELRTHYQEFTQVQTALKCVEQAREQRTIALDKYSQIFQITNGIEAAPFKKLGELNDLILAATPNVQANFEKQFDILLELARWAKNRTDLVHSGSLKTFRNKISSKTHINVALICDNQLDKNGNFLWGERGYHAKRFFENFYEIVDPSNGYSKHKVRRNPNGMRDLAIGNLIVSTNLELLRKQLKGNSVPLVPLTEKCTSKLNNNYIYSCCCVTLDDGTPLVSDLKVPTKNHLVIGNAGDSKFVDLPVVDKDSLYIAKEGYCYINIFLSMLVNVNENDAKNFTKMVRDLVVPKLGMWPRLIDVATTCHLLSVFFPDTRNAELPRILVDHSTQTMHVIDSYGSLTTGFHVLKANTVNQLVNFASEELESDMKNYIVGGTDKGQNKSTTSWDVLKCLIHSIYKPERMSQILEQEPYMLALAMLSPSVLIELYNSSAFEEAITMWVDKDMAVVNMATLLESLARKVSCATHLVVQHALIENQARTISDTLLNGSKTSNSYALVQDMLEVMATRSDTDKTLAELGYCVHNASVMKHIEKNYIRELKEAWQELTLCERSRLTWRSLKFSNPIAQWRDKGLSTKFLRNKCRDCVESSFGVLKSGICKSRDCIQNKCCSYINGAKQAVIRTTIRVLSASLPDLLKLVNVLAVISLLLTIIHQMQFFVSEYRSYKQRAVQAEHAKLDKIIYRVYSECEKIGDEANEEEFRERLHEYGAQVEEHYQKNWVEHGFVIHQAKNVEERKLEQVIAVMTLIAMLYSPERSDCLYKILNKVKGILGTVESDVYHQTDSIRDILEQKEATIDFSLQSDNMAPHTTFDTTFAEWWTHQLNRNNVVSHYRQGGQFIEFTRATSATVCQQIEIGTEREYLVRGAVGSGKSTGLPFHLSRKAQVLIIEPTRPLAENVSRQLRGEPFFASPTLRMRGLVSCGSSAIDIMTSGYALHYLANSRLLINSYSYIIFDECHVFDSQAMAFYCLLKDHDFPGKILKVSATPPGREAEFTTQFPVSISTEETLSFQQFVLQQGSGSNADVLSKGDNILVYVSSYNEVDQLSKLLLERKFNVTKVDGRTMKVGQVEIKTHGTPSKKHFIVATNIIENGVTLDIDVVVDFGLKVIADMDVDNRATTYRKTSINYGERIQRLGRVGRHKPGHALRIGHTEKGIQDVPVLVATDAAFLSFTYGLPVMTHNVTTSILGKCTRKQAATIMQFELPSYFMVGLVNFNGAMHPKIHEILRNFKIRESETLLQESAVPYKQVAQWITAEEYTIMGYKTGIEGSCKLPYYNKDIPDQLYEQIWKAVCEHRGDVGFGKLRTHSACKVAYTLETDVLAIPRTLAIIEALICNELEKQSVLNTLKLQSCTASGFSLVNIANAIRSKYAVDHTERNIEILQRAKAQLLEFHGIERTANYKEVMANYGILQLVQHQSKETIAKLLKLKGTWNTSLICRDIIVNGGLLIGGCWMIGQFFYSKIKAPVYHQGWNKRQRQKLKFRNAANVKLGREVYCDDGTAEHYFGSAYTKQGKKKGRHTTRGMGTKTRKFVNIYGFDPSEYAIVRYVDPLTGATHDAHPLITVDLIQEHFGKIREEKIANEELDSQRVSSNPGIQAYYMKLATNAALKVDLTPHNPMVLCQTNTIAGFPEREFELRQTGKAIEVDISQVPAQNEIDVDDVQHEGAALHSGVRDYNNISTSICHLTNEANGGEFSLFGIGFGQVIITNRHLFKENNGSLRVKSHHGEFIVKNTTTLKMIPVGMTDILIIQMPKDYPPLPMKLKFRSPVSSDKICIVGSNFQTKYISSLVSETSSISMTGDGTFWQHWITTKDGHCGLPLVCTKDGCIVGLHSLSTLTNAKNFFASIPQGFNAEYLETLDSLDWKKHWKYNPSEICWSGLRLHDSQPSGLFKVSKLISDLDSDLVYEQAQNDKWMFKHLDKNLKAVAQCPGQLVTKHIVKGPCMLFQTYLNTNPEAHVFFRPLMGAYGKSCLNKNAYVKDLMKYSREIIVGDLDYSLFERAIQSVKMLLKDHEFGMCEYVTDETAIIDSLNMKSAVGALYTGKKKDYFKDFSEQDKAQIVQDSCERLYTAKKGIWNGSLKAELRPLEKIHQNKTRTFTAAPLDTLLGGKVCVDDFNNRFYDLNLDCEWTVGMTKFYGGWDKLLRKLPDGWIYCDADGSQFDSSLTPCLLNAVLEIRLEMMEEWDIGEQMLRNLYTEIIYTPIATPDGTVVKKFKGNNSGQPSTVVDNTLMVLLAMFYALHKSGISYQTYKQHCQFFINGDDLLIAVNGAFGESALDTFEQSFSELGLNYKFDSRTREKTELWFMSHRGLLIDEMYIPKLEPERVVSILEWDRSVEPEHRLEAICAAMIESWGYPELTHQIRLFYRWVLTQAPYAALASVGKAPYISELALKNLYTGTQVKDSELEVYISAMEEELLKEEDYNVYHQTSTSSNLDAGRDTPVATGKKKDKDLDTGTSGTFSVPRLRQLPSKMSLPKVRGKTIVNLPHLITYTPDQIHLSNTRSTMKQFEFWYEGVKKEYEVDDAQMEIIMNGLMVWCIENGTSPNLNGMWVMMEGEEQVEFPLKPVIEFAQPTFRQIMAHFSNVAEAYIEKRNSEQKYMPRYGLQRNLTDYSLARYAFDFYEMTSKTPVRAREAHMQMKAAAIRGTTNRLFGLDGNISQKEEDTERHTTEDVNRKMHSLLGVSTM